MCEQCKEALNKQANLFWEQVKTNNLVIERLEKIADMFFELLKMSEKLLEEHRASIIEAYIKKRIAELEDKQKLNGVLKSATQNRIAISFKQSERSCP